MARDILVVDDEADIRELVGDILSEQDYEVRLAANSMEVMQAVDQRMPMAIVLDIWLQGSELDGLGILEVLKQKNPYVPVVVMSGHGTIETAVSAIKMGAYDYIEKPFTEEKLLIVLKRAFEAMKLRKENSELRRKIGITPEITGSSMVANQLRTAVEKVAPTSSRVLITGPAGSGKEVVARLIHQKSKRSQEPFIVFNASTLPLEKVEHELFGVEETVEGQSRLKRIGLLERAHMGTLFIDEVADMPLPVQNRILRFLQEQSFERAGGSRPVKVDVRIIAASNRDLEEEIHHGHFRQDLFYRLNVVPLKVPPLTERRDDIPALCQYFLKGSAEFSGLPSRVLAEDALLALQAYHWPGNIRQLRNVMEWLLIMAPGPNDMPVRASMLPPEILCSPTLVPDFNVADMLSMPLREAREFFEKHYLTSQISRFNGNISRTSTFIGMERSALHRKLKLLNIHASGEPVDEEYVN